jgi:uncharacterized protein
VPRDPAAAGARLTEHTPMSLELVLQNLLNPAVLFFGLGLLAVWVRSDLDIPQPLPRLLSLYLLLSIGFKGGAELHHSGVSAQALATLLAAVGMAMVVPLISFVVLRRRMGPANAAAVAATYGSVSAVTFLTAVSFLGALGMSYGGHLVAALALMESPAIIVGVVLARMSGAGDATQQDWTWRGLAHDAFLNGSVFILLGSLVIGMLTGPAGERALEPFTGGLFKGVLCVFLLDMGLVAGRRFGDVRRMGPLPVVFGVAMPVANAVAGVLIARALGLGSGDALLFTILCAGASYIAVPAAVRLAIPEANPGLYVTMALAVTFPFNIAVGLPLYMAVISWLWR